MKNKLVQSLLMSLGLLAMGPALAQNYPNKPIHIIVPFAAGGGTDSVARAMAEKLSSELGQPVIVDNKIGAGGSIGASAVARAPTDGYTLLLANNAHCILPNMQKTDWDPIKDFKPVTTVLEFHLMIMVNASSPITSLNQLIATAKAQPGKLSYGSSGIGGPIHLGMEIFKSRAGVDILHVPYKGNAPLTTALLGGEVTMSMDTLSVSLPQVRQGKFRGLAVTSARRMSLVPDIPTVSEAGVPGFEYGGWQGILVAANTPADIVNRLNAAILKVVAMPTVSQKLMSLGYEPRTSTPEEFATVIANDLQTYRKVIRDANIKAE